MPNNKPQVVILGCGYAGATVARALERVNCANVTVVERNATLTHKIAGIRAATVGGEFAARASIKVCDIVKKGKFVQGSATAVDPHSKTVTVQPVDGGSEITVPYDVLVAATGATSDNAGDLHGKCATAEQAFEYFQQTANALSAASKLVICGGGASACEFAGEIAAFHPHLDITLLAAGDSLFNSSIAAPPAKFVRTVERKLKSAGVKVLTGHRMQSPARDEFPDNGCLVGDRTVTVLVNGTDKVDVACDMVMWCASWKLNNSAYPDSWLGPTGEITILDTFQVENDESGCTFSCGDLTDQCETKQQITAGKKLKMCSANVIAVCEALAAGKTAHDATLKEYEITTKVKLFLPMGPSRGVTTLPNGWTFGDYWTAKWKGRDLFTTRFWNELAGMPPPKANVSATKVRANSKDVVLHKGT